MIKYFLNYIALHRQQLMRFIMVGLTTCGIYFLSFHLFYSTFGLDYRVGASFAYVITVISHFLLNRSFTFGAAEQEVIYNIWKYVLMLIFNYANVLIIMWLCVNFIKTSPYMGIIMSTGSTALINF